MCVNGIDSYCNAANSIEDFAMQKDSLCDIVIVH